MSLDRALAARQQGRLAFCWHGRRGNEAQRLFVPMRACFHRYIDARCSCRLSRSSVELAPSFPPRFRILWTKRSGEAAVPSKIRIYLPGRSHGGEGGAPGAGRERDARGGGNAPSVFARAEDAEEFGE